MLDVNFVKENSKLIKSDLKKRDQSEKQRIVDQVLKLESKRIATQKRLDSLRHERNDLSKEINILKKQNKNADQLIKKAKDLPKKIKDLEQKYDTTSKKLNDLLMSLPNVLDDSVPIGKDDSENKVVKTWGKKPKIGFDMLPHGEFLEKNNLADFKKAAEVSGSGFYYLKNELALLDLALQRFAIDSLIKKGFSLIIPPFMLNRESYEGVTDLADFENVMYKLENEDLYLIATSEHPLAALYKNEVIEEKDLPIKLVGLSPCFRKEIGSHGVDTRGIFRVHQFNKVEQFVYSKPKDSWKIHEELQKNSEELFQKLEIPYRVVNVCTGDMGVVAAKKYDIEGWFPREKEYKELTSCSNCTAYQAVRSNIKLKTSNGSKEYVHTLNNTGIATARAMRAIVENHQQKDGSIKIPKALQPYMNGLKIIGGK